MTKSKPYTYHNPVMLNECIEHLNIDPDGTYVDYTFGGGGHSTLILSKLSNKGKLFGFDRDKDAQKNTLNDPRFTLIPENFRYAKNFLQLHGTKQVDGILADLGISSYQIDKDAKGFSIRSNADLDMRMNINQTLSAKEIVNNYSVEELTKVLREYGEVDNAYRASNIIAQKREIKAINTTFELIKSLEECSPKFKTNKYLAKIFQGIRIEVNDELGALKDALKQSIEIIKPGGRFVIMSYHSLEDRLVKNFFRYGDVEAKEPTKDLYGNILRPFKPLKNKIITPGEKEIEENPRAKSAKLRVGIKND